MCDLEMPLSHRKHGRAALNVKQFTTRRVYFRAAKEPGAMSAWRWSNSGCDGGALPLPLAGEGWGGGSLHESQCGESPHPYRIFDAIRPPPQAGEVQRCATSTPRSMNRAGPICSTPNRRLPCCAT
ncbi:hypothetical protein XI02_38195 [Bradyrhizobium sp. CCBAU 21365]|nr:hypothetical protein XI02_38195 [Bradyrhizobium sp. CCBAU 21365]